MDVIEIMARASLTVDYADSEKTHPGITAEALDDDHVLEGYLAQAQAALTALADAGYAIVPVEPSEAMTAKGGNVLDCADSMDAAQIYGAMVEAGPLSRQESEFWKMRDLVYDLKDKQVRDIVMGESPLARLFGGKK